MRVYLVSDKGNRTAFKITKAKVVTSIDSIIRMRSEQIIERGTQDFVSSLTYYPSYSLNIYYGDLDDISNSVKKVNEKMWKEWVLGFIAEYPNKVLEYCKREK